MKYELIKLNYDYDALEPFIDAKTMEIHHTKHHQAYVNNLNAALDKYPEIKNPLFELLQNPELIPEDIRAQVINHGGGTYNHNLFFTILKKNDGLGPKGHLLTAINRDFGSFDEFVNLFQTAAKSQFGSGWAWLVTDLNGNLSVTSTANQNVPKTGIPILAIDVWEHAYYLQYQNRRPDYVSAFSHVINWDEVEKRYLNR
ncbi:MAG: superoxide dismutase [Acholeplasmataceae bacterium]|jgi:Fe-Mn family superoxide dismutase|nr:superoxide dismutase [Acholeplasmataceae bacterium]